METYRFTFNEPKSASLDTKIQVLNYPIITTVMMVKALLESYYLKFAGPLAFNAVAMALKASGEQLVEQRTAGELLDGRKVKLVEYLDYMLTPLKSIGVPIPMFGLGPYKLNNASFGFVSQRLFTEFGPFEVYTRTEDGHTFGEIFKLHEST